MSGQVGVGAGDFQQAVKASELPAGSKQVVELGGVQVLVCNSNGKIFAVSNICSHAQETLDCGRMGNGWIACPIHGARFDLATGAAKNPPATRPIPVYETRLEGEWIEVKI
jgi:3-phenylpropionate/trans-cinnamate dioxygenase ferredoxin component